MIASIFPLLNIRECIIPSDRSDRNYFINYISFEHTTISRSYKLREHKIAGGYIACVLSCDSSTSA